MFGFNGMEKDNEVKGVGNSYTTEFRQYNPRLGRWFSVDPEFKNFAWQSPYAAFDNNPISKSDPRGDAAGDPAKLTSAAESAVKAVKASDNGTSLPAKCNIGVNTAFTELTGSNELSGKLANDMATHMANSANWTPIPISEAQGAANNGEIVIATYLNPSGSGHVALVVPGETSNAGTWEGQPASSIGGLPHVMDTGAGKRTEDQTANYSFGKKIQDDVIFYKYTPALTNGNSSENEKQAGNPKPESKNLPAAPQQVHDDGGNDFGRWLMDAMPHGSGGYKFGMWLDDNY